MLNDADGFKHIYLATGKTDLRKGIDGMMLIVRDEFELDPVEQGNIFLFCGSRGGIIKALVFEEDGFVLLTKRLTRGRFQWPRNRREVLDLTEEQYHKLMDGFAIEYKSTIEKIKPLYI